MTDTQIAGRKNVRKEVGRPLPGRFIASRDDLRVDAGCGPSGRGDWGKRSAPR